MPERRIQRRLPEDFVAPSALSELGLPLARVLAARGLSDAGELGLGADALLPGAGLRGLEGAVELLTEALDRQRRILIVGDFDADGATSSALAVLGLRDLGAAAVDYLVPNRFEYGYGLTPELVAEAVPRRPWLIVTVDNGIASHEGVAAAQAAGIRVLVTDHHLPGARLPAADAIVNPNQPDDGFPSKNLAGVGVMFYVLLALRAHLRARGDFTGRDEPRLAEYLDLVALGTVADVVPLDRNNRVLVEQGLRRIRAGRCRPGVRALLEVAGRDLARVVATDLGFFAGPRLNAAGRLTDMSIGIECLLSADATRARALAEQLDALNRERRDIEAKMQDEALTLVDALDASLPSGGLPPALALFDPGWHQGVVGLLAGRLKERLHRPVIAFAPGEGGLLKGSARSIPGLHIRDLLATVAARHPGLITRFGGHAMAAGLSLPREALEEFEAALEAVAGEWLDPEALRPVVLSDGPLLPHGLSLDTARALRGLGPWGQAFPEPVFDDVFELRRIKPVGGDHLKASLLPDSGQPVEAIEFRADPTRWPAPGGRLRLAYRADVNCYRGMESLQLVVEHVQAL